MAITKIYKIKSTGNKSLSYGTEDKSSSYTEEYDSSSKSLNYIMRDKNGNKYSLSESYIKKMSSYISFDKRNKMLFKTISSSLNCSVINAYNEWQSVRFLKNKANGENGNIQYCIVQNFGTDLDPLVANEIGYKFAQKYLNEYQVVISTHINTGFVHNHIEFNATSFVNGKKFDDKLKVINEIRKISDEFCKEYNLNVLEKTMECDLKFIKNKDGTLSFFESKNSESSSHNFLESEQFDNISKAKITHEQFLKNDISDSLKSTKNWDEFKNIMYKKGYVIKDKTKSGDFRVHTSYKHITWDKFIRDTSLGDKYLRENIINYFVENINNVEPVIEDDVFIDNITNIQLDFINSKNVISKIIYKDIISSKKELIDIKKATHFIPDRKGKETYLIDRIKSNFKTIEFIENKNINSFDDIKNNISELYSSKERCLGNLKDIKLHLDKYKNVIEKINKYNTLSLYYEKIKISNDYNIEEVNSTLSIVLELEKELKLLSLLDQISQESFVNKYNMFKNEYISLYEKTLLIESEIKQYDFCVGNLEKIDRQYDNFYKNDINNYLYLKNHYDEKFREENAINEEERE